MPVEIWMTENGKWFWTCRSPNGEVISDSAEVYSSRAKAVNGARATATEFLKWQLGRAKPWKFPKVPTSGRSKPAGKPSTLSSSQIRKTVKRGG